ncbi:hypothetical protein [Candidatus Nitrospira bockiana]
MKQWVALFVLGAVLALGSHPVASFASDSGAPSEEKAKDKKSGGHVADEDKKDEKKDGGH